MEKVMVTGGAGFIGSHTVERLLETGYEVAVVDNLITGKKENIPDYVKLYRTSILDAGFEYSLSDFKPNKIIHLAAQISVSKSMKDMEFDQLINISGTTRLIQLANKYNVKKIVFSSTAAVYGKPVNLPISEKEKSKPESPYGLSKLVAEQYLHWSANLYGLKYTILRYSNVFGPRQNANGEGGVISIFFDRLLNDKQVYIHGDGNNTRDFIYVKDVANANAKALQYGDNKTFNISTESSCSIKELFNLIRDVSGSSTPPIYTDSRAGDIKHSKLNNTKALGMLDWQAHFDLMKGLKETLEYLKFGRGLYVFR